MEEIIILFVLLLLSAFFSGAETALTTISIIRVESLLQEGRTGAGALFKLKSNVDRMLITILIGNNLVNIAASAMATIMATNLFGDMGPGLAVGGLTMFVLIFGEITPKTFSARHTVAVALFVAPPLYIFAKIVTPLVWVLEQFTKWLHSFSNTKGEPTVTESDLINLVQHGANEGSIEKDEQQMIQRVLELDGLCAEDIMIPRHEMITINGNTKIKDALPKLLELSHTRIPLHNGNLEEVSKVINLRDIMGRIVSKDLDATLFDCGYEPLFVPKNQPLNEILLALRIQKNRLTLVVDALGVLQGMLCLEDILEELVGEIYDHREPPTLGITEIAKGEVRVNGHVELRLLEEYFNQDLQGKPTDSVSQWILNQLGHIPTPKDNFTIEGLQVDVERASPRAINTVKIIKTDNLTESL